VVTVVTWSFGLGYLFFKLMDRTVGIRVSPEEELQGLDVLEHGSPAYPEFIRHRMFFTERRSERVQAGNHRS